MTKQSTPATLDFAALDTVKAANAGIEYEFTHPQTGAPLGAFVTFYGKDSETLRTLQKERMNKYQRERAAAERKGKDYIVSAEELEEYAIDLCAAATISFRNVTLDGVEVTKANAKDFYRRFIWARKQLDTELESSGDYLK